MDRKNQITLAVGTILIYLSLFPTPSTMPAEIYKWKDKDGNIFFSDTPPPPGVDTEVKKFKDEPTGKLSPKVEPPPPKIQITKQKRPYSDIQVIMYMTAR